MKNFNPANHKVIAGILMLLLSPLFAAAQNRLASSYAEPLAIQNLEPRVDDKVFSFYVPNAFTPDGDGLNDVFAPKGDNFNSYSFLIFDRWGKQLFATQDPAQGWDGTYKGQTCPGNVYVYIIAVRDVASQTLHHYDGTLLLVEPAYTVHNN